MSLHVIEPGLRSTVQDAGRLGHLRSAIPPAGPADPFAFDSAQWLVGNARDAAGIEIVGLPFRFTVNTPRLVAATGREVSLRTRSRIGGWTAAFVRVGDEVVVEGTERTRYAYLAVAGGLALPPVLGSRATYLPAGIGPVPRALRAGDLLPLGEARVGAVGAGRTVLYEYDHVIKVLTGPHADRLSGGDGAFAGRFRVSERSDRMGVRLEGKVEVREGEILSVGMIAGALQVPAGGEPIVLLADHQTTGGYPVVAVVIRADLGAVAQAAPGEELTFRLVDRTAAVEVLALQQGRYLRV